MHGLICFELLEVLVDAAGAPRIATGLLHGLAPDFELAVLTSADREAVRALEEDLQLPFHRVHAGQRWSSEAVLRVLPADLPAALFLANGADGVAAVERAAFFTRVPLYAHRADLQEPIELLGACRLEPWRLEEVARELCVRGPEDVRRAP